MGDLEKKLNQDNADGLESQKNESFTPEALGDPRFDVNARRIIENSVIRLITYSLINAEPQTAANYGNMFIADRGYKVIGFSEVHRVACTSTGTVTLEKCPSGTAPNSGTELLESVLALNTPLNTPQFGMLNRNRDYLLLKRGDRLVLKDSGTLTTTEDVLVTVYLIGI